MESGDPKASRHVGRIIDPAVMDGTHSEFTEPILENSAVAATNVLASEPPPPPPDSSGLLDDDLVDASDSAWAAATQAVPGDTDAGGDAPSTDAPNTPANIPGAHDTGKRGATAAREVAVPEVAATQHGSLSGATTSGEHEPSAARVTSSVNLETTQASDVATGPTDATTKGAVSDADASHEAATSPAERPPAFLRTGHPVRDRLLAKAAEAQIQTEAKAPVEPGTPQFSSLGIVDSELDDIAAPKATSAPLIVAGTTLSSSQLLLFGTICGLAAIATLFTLLIKLSPRGHDIPDADAPSMATPTSTATAPAAALTASAATTLTPPPARELLEGPWRIGSAGTGQKLIEGEIGREPFLRAIQNAGISKNQAYRVYTALKEEKNLDRCRPSDSFRALLDRASDRIVAFEYIVDKEEVYQAKEGKDGLLRGKQLDLQVRRQRVQGAMTIVSESFAEAARSAHLEPSLGNVINRALDGHTSVSQFQRGDRLRVVAQEVTVLGQFSRYAGIEALEYLPVAGDPIRIYYFTQRKRYYDARGRAPGEGGWRRPVKDAPITSKFNPARLHPILKKRMPHNGTDFGAPTGTPIYAALYGTVTKLGNYGANGNFIAIEHPRGYETGYSHLSRFESGLKVGDKVKTMQPIGYVGSTGRSTGPHLHFSAKKSGQFIDPESLGLDALTVLPAPERAAFQKVKEHYDELLEAVVLPPPLAQPAALAAVNPSNEEAPEDEDPMAPSLDEEFDEPSTAVHAEATQATPAAVVPAAAQAAPPGPTPGQVPAAQGQFNSLYLSDKELMQSQSASDDGEVDE